MHWTFGRVPEGEPDLIIGDCPIMLTEPSSEEEQKPLGIQNPNIEIVLPLSRNMVAIARWSGPNSFGELVKGTAEIINLRTLSYARRFIFAPYESTTLLSEAVRLRGSGPKVNVRRIQMGKGLAIVSEYR
jgi:hypothetical protein